MSEIFTLRNGDDSSDDRPRLVLDTNTVLALWMFRDPKLEALRAWIEAGNCLLLSREDALEELRRVLAYRQFGLDEDFQDALLDEYRTRLAPRTAERNNKNPDNAERFPGAATLTIRSSCRSPCSQPQPTCSHGTRR